VRAVMDHRQGRCDNGEETVNRASALIMLTGLSLAANLAPAAEPLGRFFFTPAQRAQLDIARSQKSRATLASEQTDEAAAQPLPEVLTYRGSVRRSDGKSTVWLNNQTVQDQQPVEGLAVVGRVNANGDVTLQVPQTNRTIELKPGQSVDIGSGIVEEPFARDVTAPKPETKPPATASVAGKPEPAKPLAPGEKAAAAGTPEQKVLEAQPESALERLRRTRPEGIGNAPDRR
jgi:hypothetical protein